MSTRISALILLSLLILGCGPTYPLPVSNESWEGKMAYEASVLAVLERLKETHSIRATRLRPEIGIADATITQIGKDRFQVKSRLASFNPGNSSFHFQYECVLVRDEDKFRCEGVFVGKGAYTEW